jgi:putative ABC transport system permease protein
MNKKSTNLLDIAIIATIIISTSVFTFALERIFTLNSGANMQDSDRASRIKIAPKSDDYTNFLSEGDYVPLYEISKQPDKKLTLADIQYIRDGLPDAENVYVDRIEFANIAYNKIRMQDSATISSVSREYSISLGFKLISGAFPSKEDYASKRNLISISEWTARRYFDNQNALGKIINIESPYTHKTSNYTISAVFRLDEEEIDFSTEKNPGGRIGFIPIGSGSIFYLDQIIDSINIQLKPGDSSYRLARTKEYIKKNYGLSMGVHSNLEDLKKYKDRQSITNIILVLFSAGGLVVSCISLTNHVTSKLKSRTREISISLALGASRNNVLLENITVLAKTGLIGGSFGAVIAVLIEFVGNTFPQWNIAHTGSVLWPLLLLSPLTGVLSCVLFGFVPVWEASRIRVAEILK